MEESLKDYIGKMMIGKRFRFLCNCIISMDVTGTIKDYEISSNEIIFFVDTGAAMDRKMSAIDVKTKKFIQSI